MALKWGICGAGNISNDFCSALKTLPAGEHEIVAVAARDVSRAKEFGDKFGATKDFGTYDEVASDPEIDIVYIGTINTQHHPLSIMMLKAGKHVLCEKPMAINLRQCKEILQVAKEKKSLFYGDLHKVLFWLKSDSIGVGNDKGFGATWSRSFPIYDQIRKELASGSLGDVSIVTAKFCIASIGVERVKNNKLGGGCLLDIGVYTLQFACMVFDEMPEKIIASAVVNEDGVDEDGAIILRYKGGRMASLVYSGKTHFLEKSCASIHGSKGSIEIPTTFWCPSEATMPSGHYTNDLPLGPVKYNYMNGGGLRYQADNARKCIKEGKIECPAMSHRHNELIFTILDEIRRQIGVKYEEDK